MVMLAAYHRSVELLGGVVVIVLVSSPVASVGQEPPVCWSHTLGVATKVPLDKPVTFKYNLGHHFIPPTIPSHTSYLKDIKSLNVKF